MFKPSLMLSALILPVLAVMATADEPTSADSSGVGALFSQLDQNSDGQLTTDEVPEDRRLLFDRLLRIGDKNGDEKLDASEFAVGLAGSPDESDKADSPSNSERPDSPDRANREPGRLFERLDANDDGRIELDEVPEPGRERFQKLLARVDKDGDGAVTRREFAQAGPRPDAKKGDARKTKKQAKRPQANRDPSQLFRRLDRDADGKLSVDEVPEDRRPMFERLIQRGDKDDDAKLTLEEFSAVFGKRGPTQPPRNTNPQRNKAKGNRAKGSPAGLFGAIDTDHDGQLNDAEIASAADAIRKLDKDGDGAVSAREVMAGAVRNKKKPK